MLIVFNLSKDLPPNLLLQCLDLLSRIIYLDLPPVMIALPCIFSLALKIFGLNSILSLSAISNTSISRYSASDARDAALDLYKNSRALAFEPDMLVQSRESRILEPKVGDPQFLYDSMIGNPRMYVMQKVIGKPYPEG